MEIADSTSENVGGSNHYSKKRVLECEDNQNDVVEVPRKIAKISNNIGRDQINKKSISGGKCENAFSKTTHAKKSTKSKVFKFGNYPGYYGYRHPDQDEDMRHALWNSEWFYGKDVLDVGCNVGQVTLEIALKYYPNRIVGIDIDRDLIFSAKKNLKQRLEDTHSQFKESIHFVQGNYVPDSDDSLSIITQEFDVILALSLTKWIHLNFGDDGLKRFFKKIYLQLKPGGLFILEPQTWSTYKKKKHITERHNETYKSLKFLPQSFTSFLLSDEVGFSEWQPLGISNNQSKGFQRSMFLFKKA